MDTSNNNHDSSGDEGGGASFRKKKIATKKKALVKAKSDSRSVSSADNRSLGSKARKKANDVLASDTPTAMKQGNRRKSQEANGPKKEGVKLNLPPKPQGSSQRDCASHKSDEGSAVTGGSGGSRNQLTKKGSTGSRSRSPPPESVSAKRKSQGIRTSGSPSVFDSDSKASKSRLNSSVRSLGQSSQNNSVTGEANSKWENENAFGSGFGSFSEMNNEAFSDTFFSPTAFADTGAATFNNTPDSAAFFEGNSSFQQGFGSPDPFGKQLSFENTPHFDHERREKLAKSPFKEPPQRARGKLSLVKKTEFSQHFASDPVTNPLNGNLMFCASRGGEMYMQEVDPQRNFVQVMSAPILTAELNRKVTKKYSRAAHGIDNVLKLSVGVVWSQGQPRVRMVTIIDLLILDSKHILRAIAVWQWGYGTAQPVALQYLLSPPSGTDYSYDPESIVTADDVLFVAGASAKGPCVFMCKPSVRESWSANFLAPSGKISTMAVITNTKRHYPYLAVGMTDGSLSVWSYDAALKQVASKKNEPFRRLLYPLCRLEGLWVLKSIPATSFTDDKQQSGDDSQDVGMCTHLEWLPPQPSFSSLLQLAASFQSGVTVFHVALPFMADQSKKGNYVPIPAPTQSTQLNMTPQIRPFAAIRFTSQNQESHASWIDFGPHNNPCLAFLLRGKSSDDEAGRVVLAAINMAQYRKDVKPKESLASFRILTSSVWKSKSKSFPLGLISCNSFGGVKCRLADGILSLTPSLSASFSDPCIQSLRHPISSSPPGLNSAGEVARIDTLNDKEGILHVYTINQCDHVKNDAQPNLLHWSRPARRHWLCQTVCGDRKETQKAEEAREASQFGDEDEPTLGGSASDVVCELDGEGLAGLVPFRIVRSAGSSICAVLFRPVLGNYTFGGHAGVSVDCVSVAIVNVEAGKTKADIEVFEGRDVAFLPSANQQSARMLLLARNGGSLSLLTYDASIKKWRRGTTCRPILGVECDNNYVEAQRLFCISYDAKYGLMLVGRTLSDDRCCILGGPTGAVDQSDDEAWTNLLPEMSAQPFLLLDIAEEVFSLVAMPYEKFTSAKLAVATSSRVLLVTGNLEILAECRTTLSSGSLAPLGSSAVSFASADSKVRYLCCLEAKFQSGVVATLPSPKFGYSSNLLVALRPDRFLYSSCHAGSSLVEHDGDPDAFLLPTAVTRPAMLLEPLLANAVYEGGKREESAPLIRGIIEKFGRKVASITHGDEEGIGNRGTGISPRAYEILSHHGLKEAASWLLTGVVQFDRSANSKILPPWLPVSAKEEAALNSDALLHLVANGDRYLSEYVQSPDRNISSALPRPSDPTSYLCREVGQDALARGDAADALKLLDLGGTESTDSLLLQLCLLLELKSGDSMDLLKALCEQDGESRSDLPGANSSLAALAVSLKLNGPRRGMNDEEIMHWMKPLAPTLQKGTRFGRRRQRLLGEGALGKAGGSEAQTQIDPLWLSPCNESRHVWNEGPNKEKESLLLLDKMEDWLGRRRPTLLGKARVAAAEERGEGALANILDMDKDEPSTKDESDGESSKQGWVEGVGESRVDEENLSAYFRFWEGEDEDCPWHEEGFSDLSNFQNKAVLVGQKGRFALQPTTSSVDEGEPGKVKLLYDLVFEASVKQEPLGLAVEARRGGSLDLGVLHTKDRSSRHRCTLEFWYYLPPCDKLSREIILVRRTMGPSADDLLKVCTAAEKLAVLWEIALLKSGELEFRSCGGTVLRSSAQSGAKASFTPADDQERPGFASFERWNHLCVVLSSKDLDRLTDCHVTLFMQGNAAASVLASMLPRGFTLDQLETGTALDNLMLKSHLVFGLDHAANLRLTELRVWACERSEEDIKFMMREYLDAAEGKKKKFRVKIGKNKKRLLTPPTVGLVPPKAGGLALPKADGTPPRPAFLAPPKGSAPTLATLKVGLLAPPKDRQVNPSGIGAPGASHAKAASCDASFGTFGKLDEARTDQALNSLGTPPSCNRSTLWDTAVPLSQQVRASAAAALIRGPPATRHFGGNRGGLPDLRGTERYGVGGIAICGSEKTIVWRDEEDPPALTYPIGASGAIVSDQLDDEEGSEFLCCFLAKDKRMVVFELNSRTVVVELQMTTKLNFWRFLPPEAGESTLCFMLITPVGGFHWMPLDDSPRPRQVWKRGPDLQGKKIVSYEEGGTNGVSGPGILSRVGLIGVTDANGTGSLESWIVPICGDSGAIVASHGVLGAALCVPENVGEGPFMPNLICIVKEGGIVRLIMMAIEDRGSGSVGIGEAITSETLPLQELQHADHEAPALAMGNFPDAICCSLGNIIVVILRALGAMIAYEFKNSGLQMIAKEDFGQYIVDAVMRYSAIEVGAEIVMLLSDKENPKDGRIVSFYFRSAA